MHILFAKIHTGVGKPGNHLLVRMRNKRVAVPRGGGHGTDPWADSWLLPPQQLTQPPLVLGPAHPFPVVVTHLAVRMTAFSKHPQLPRRSESASPTAPGRVLRDNELFKSKLCWLGTLTSPTGLSAHSPGQGDKRAELRGHSRQGKKNGRVRSRKHLDNEQGARQGPRVSVGRPPRG